MCGVYPDASLTGAGEEISSTNEGRHITMREDELKHPVNAGGFVDKGDPVIICKASAENLFGNAVGVAFNDGASISDLISVDTEGIWKQSVVAITDGAVNSAVVPGDLLYINTTTCIISKITNIATQIPFGYALGNITAGQTRVIAVKVHFDPNWENSMQVWKTINVANPGDYGAAMKLIVDSNIAQTGGRLCAMSINLEPGAGLAARAITGAEVCTYLAADIPVAGVLTGLFVETQGGLSFASDVYSLYAYLAPGGNPTGNSSVIRVEANAPTPAWVDSFIHMEGSPVNALRTGAHGVSDSKDGDKTTGHTSQDGWMAVNAGGFQRYIQLYKG